MRSVLGFCCALALVALAGCASRNTSDACTKPPPQQQYACDDTAVTAALGPTSLLKSPTPIDMLFLSGGGSHGAYGAGVLNGWSTASRPEFAVVTGVSAGALHSTWAFLGGSQFDQEMYHNYTSISDDEIYKTRPFIALLWSSSTTTADGLRQLIEKAVPNGTIDLVAAQKRQAAALCRHSESGYRSLRRLGHDSHRGRYGQCRPRTLPDQPRFERASALRRTPNKMTSQSERCSWCLWKASTAASSVPCWR